MKVLTLPSTTLTIINLAAQNYFFFISFRQSNTD